ncbi:MAG: hypothetical protein EPN92_01755 [Chitinophagaceae bacterium]|nr:MAG: hypothetical protein EPN92_01755 [Chitinophagaceae bacterium]
MKNLFFLIPLIAIITCSVSRQNIQPVKRLEIIKADTTRDFYVFKTMNDSSKEVIVLAEREKVNDCKPFKRFIIADSVHQTSVLKSGSGKDLVGFYLSTIDGIKIRTEGELPKIIWNCNCFTDK